MRRRKLNNPYGYKVGYQEIDSRLFVRRFITRTHIQAHRMLLFYRKYGHDCRQKDRERFNYSIKPITRKEYLAGIWDELPFPIRSFFATRRAFLSKALAFASGRNFAKDTFFNNSNANFPLSLFVKIVTLAKTPLLLRLVKLPRGKKSKRRLKNV